MNIRELIEDRVAGNPDKVYLYFEDQEITYADFDRNINRLSNRMLNCGIQKGDRFAIHLSNCPEYLYTWFALNKIGALEVPINVSLKGNEVQYILEHSGAKGIIIHADNVPVLDSIRGDLPELVHVVVVGTAENMDGKTTYREFVENSSPESPPPVHIADDDPAGMIYTSGTTGRPKGVMFSHKAWRLTAEAYVYTVEIHPDDRVMTSNPLYHINAQGYSTLGSLTAGASLILIPKFSQSRVIEQTRQYGATILVLVQALTPWVWGRPVMDTDGDNPVRTVVAGNWPPEIYKKFEERFNVKNQTIYSSTESPMGLMGPREGTGSRKVGSIGIPFEHPDPSIKNEFRIVGETGVDTKPGEVGEIIIRNPALMLGYYKDPERTAEVMKDGWFHTGDQAYKDEDGHFFFVGRAKDVIRRRGELVSPNEIEGVINRHPHVHESAVIGVDSGLGTGEEEIKAYVLLEEGETVTPEEIFSWCSDNLAEFKVPRYLEFRDEFPRSSIGRIQKKELKKEKENLEETLDIGDNLNQTVRGGSSYSREPMSKNRERPGQNKTVKGQ